MGAHMKQGFQDLQQKHEAIGDVRGRGLLIGVELVTDRRSRRPAHELGNAVTDRCLELGVNMNLARIGSLARVFTVVPPPTVSRGEVDWLPEMFDRGVPEVAREGSG